MEKSIEFLEKYNLVNLIQTTVNCEKCKTERGEK